MKAVILTAGQGSRLLPLTQSKTKGMIQIGNRPILEYIINAVRSAGISDILMVVGYGEEKVMNHFGDGRDYKMRITYLHQKRFLGTAHALSLAKDHLDGDFLVLPGDNIIDAKGLEKLVQCKNEEAAILVTSCNRPSKYGVIGLKGDYVSKLVEKPKITGDLLSTGMPSIFSLALWEYKEETISNIISTGTYRFSPSVFKLIEEMSTKDEHTLSDLIQHLLEQGRRIRAFETDLWVDAVYPFDIIDMNSIILPMSTGAVGGRIEKTATIVGPVTIGEDSEIRSGCYIQGPVVIGKGCVIGPNVVINPTTSIGQNVVVEPFTVIRNSVIMDDVNIKSHAHISNSVVAEGVKVGIGFMTDTTPSTVRLHEYSHSKQLGAIIGEDSTIGHGVVVNSGVIIGCRANISSQKTIDRNVPNGTVIM